MDRGRARGHVTYSEINAALPSDEVSSEDIEDFVAILSDLGISIAESGESGPLTDEGEVKAATRSPSTIPVPRLPTPEVRPFFIGDDYGYGWEIHAIVTPEEWEEIQSVLQRREKGR